MSCDRCPHCKSEVRKGGLSLPSDSSGELQSRTKEIETPKKPVRGKAREYTQAFEIAWKAYGRKEQKFEAFAVWLVRVKEIGGEPLLLTLVLGALKWQGPGWAADGWKFAPYFERYLKRRKWEDERPAPATQPPRPPIESFAARDARERREREQAETRAQLAAADRQVAATRAAAERVATREELEELRRLNGRHT